MRVLPNSCESAAQEFDDRGINQASLFDVRKMAGVFDWQIVDIQDALNGGGTRYVECSILNPPDQFDRQRRFLDFAEIGKMIFRCTYAILPPFLRESC